MTKERVSTEDEVTAVLYDEKGRIKQISSSRKRKSKLEKLLEFLNKVLEHW